MAGGQSNRSARYCHSWNVMVCRGHVMVCLVRVIVIWMSGSRLARYGQNVHVMV